MRGMRMRRMRTVLTRRESGQHGSGISSQRTAEYAITKVWCMVASVAWDVQGGLHKVNMIMKQ